MKKRLLVILVIGLVLLTASVAPVGGCSQGNRDADLLPSDAVDGIWFITVGDLRQPIESPFSKIIPNCQGIAEFYEGLEVAEGCKRPQTEVTRRSEST